LLELAPELKDGTIGTWVQARRLAVRLPAARGKQRISGGCPGGGPCDAANVEEHAFVLPAAR